MNETVNLLKNHKSIRNYKDQPVEYDKVKSIIECAQSASTSSFIQAYTIINVVNKENRKNIAHLAGDQVYIEQCPLFLVFCADLYRSKNCCTLSNKTMAKINTETFILATVDAALAAQNALIAAESLGLGGVYIGGIRNNPSEISKILNIPSGVYPVFGMCLGYPADNQDVKERLPLSVVFKTDEYNTDGDEKKMEEYDVKISAYYKNRTNGERLDTWRYQISTIMSKTQRPHMKGFLEDQEFIMK